MRNGNVIVGEVKRLDRGLLEFSVDDINNRLQIKWEHVTRLTSVQQLEVELRDGTQYFGSLIEPAGDGELRIRTAEGDFDVELLDVVIIVPIKETIWKRLEGEISTGISFTKATDIAQFNLGGNVSYRRRISLTELGLNSIITSKSDAPDSTNSNLQLTHHRFFKKRWFYRGDIGASRNDELGIDFRGAIGGGVGRSLIQTNRAELLVSALILGNRENTNDGLETNNLELALDTGLGGYRYDTPKLELSSNLTVFLNLTTQGRYRVNFDGRFSLELMLKDLFWDIGQVYYRYDSDPSTRAEAKDDYGFVSGLRYKF